MHFCPRSAPNSSVWAHKISSMCISDRIEQSRGMYWIAPAMPHLKLLQTYLENEIVTSSLAAIKIGSVHTVPAHIAHMHDMVGNAGYLIESATKRAVSVKESDATAKKRDRKK